MNIIIPIGGKGERFKKNYICPKPFINIYGQSIIEWLLDNLNFHENDKLYIAINEDIENKYNLEYKLKKNYPLLQIKIVRLLYQTRGAVETIFNVLQTMNNDELNKKIITLDCDTIYFDDILDKFRNNNNNTSFYFIANNKPEIFSYIRLEDDKIVDIKEKEFFNNYDKLANIGAYGFNNGLILKKYCLHLLNNDIKFNNEYYTSLIIKLMIDFKEVFNGIQFENFRCVGTPQQLHAFIKEVEEMKYKYKIKRFCFDLDNTLVTFPEIMDDYTSVKPKNDNIQVLKKLKKLGHYIIIYTARRMKTYNNDIIKVEENIKEITLSTLKLFDIPYDEIYFGKPYADHYIDDLGINALYNLEYNIGVNKENDTVIEPRYFNTIIDNNYTIIKTSISKDFDGEINFYKSILDTEYVKFFPKIYYLENNMIEMKKIDGIILSQLLVSKTLCEKELLRLLDIIKQFHNIQSVKNSNIYSNYSKKVTERFINNESIYNLNNYSKDIYMDLINYLDEYENNNLGIYSNIIHGDLVFSNIILDTNNNFIFIDPRGKLGNNIAIEGDIYYDFAKILQSLYGYDFILFNKNIDKEYLEYLRNIFYKWLKNNFSDINIFYLKIICKSLLFSLIPLHKKENFYNFFNIILEIK